MKFLVTVGIIALLLLAGTAQADDTTYDWSGVYVGAGVGYSWGVVDLTLQGNQFWGPGGGGETLTPSQFDVGGYVGAQYQWNWFVLGAEAGIYKGPNDKASEASPFYPVSDVWTADIKFITMCTAKMGFAYKRFLGYVKGGYAGALVDTQVALPAAGLENKTSEWHNGATVGGGIEYALTNHWIIGAEYNYIYLISKDHSDVGLVNYSAEVDAAVHQALFRVGFKF
jgi:outer membrane immunogenic protein